MAGSLPADSRPLYQTADKMRRVFALLAGCVLSANAVCAQEIASPPETASAESPAELDESRWYVQGDYLVWWLRRDRVPPLLTTSPAASLGIIGQPGTAVVYPGDDGKLE